MPVWVAVPLSTATAAALSNRADILKAADIAPDLPTATIEIPDPLVKVYVDYMDEDAHSRCRTTAMDTLGRPGDFYYDLQDERWQNFKCNYRHEACVCKCCLPLYHIGQDEAVFKQYALPSKVWKVEGKSKLRPKSDGQGIMVSAIVDEWRGFGLPMSIDEVNLVNRVREEAATAAGVPHRKLIEAGQSPGLLFFNYGKGKEGYWDGVKFQEQCIDFMDVIEILYPGMQILLEVDHSSGHLKEQTDGLMVNAMSLRWGGKTVPKRDSVIEDGCLGETLITINGKQLTIGAIQKMVFEEGDPCPFNDPTAQPRDTPMNLAQRAKEIESRKRRKKTPDSADGSDEDAGVNDLFVVPGYVGKNKGILQVCIISTSILQSELF